MPWQDVIKPNKQVKERLQEKCREHTGLGRGQARILGVGFRGCFRAVHSFIGTGFGGFNRGSLFYRLFGDYRFRDPHFPTVRIGDDGPALFADGDLPTGHLPESG